MAQTEEKIRIPSRTLNKRILELAEEMGDQEKFGAKMFPLLSRIVKLRHSYIQNYLGYSVAERRDVSGLLEQADRMYDDLLQMSRNLQYNRLMGAKTPTETRG